MNTADHLAQTATELSAMPFNVDGFYAHDFRRLPIIWEQDEGSDDEWSSCVEQKSSTSGDFRPGSSFTSASEQQPSPTSTHSDPRKWGTPSPYLRTYRSWKRPEEEQRRPSVPEDRRPINRQSFITELNGRTPNIKTKRKWNIFKKWSKPRFPIDDSDEESTDSDSG